MVKHGSMGASGSRTEEGMNRDRTIDARQPSLERLSQPGQWGSMGHSGWEPLAKKSSVGHCGHGMLGRRAEASEGSWRQQPTHLLQGPASS